MSLINLDELINKSQLNFSLTSENEHPKDADIRRIKDMSLFFVTVILVLSAFLFCGYILLNKDFSPDDKKWATAIASSIVSSLLGYRIGKNIS